MLLLQCEVPRRRLYAGHPRKADQIRGEKGAGIGHPRFPSRGLLRPRTRGLSDGCENAQDLPERDQHYAWLYLDQHVSEAVGGVGGVISGTDRAAKSARP